MGVELLTMTIFGDLIGYLFVNYRDEASSIM